VAAFDHPDILRHSKGEYMGTSAKGLRVLAAKAKAKRIIEEVGLQVATPNEARAMLKLKGARDVNF